MSRLTTPDDSVGMDYVVGAANKRYRVPTIERVDAELADITRRVGNYQRDKKFPDLVKTLTDDLNLLLDRRCYLMMLPPAADLGAAPDTDRGLVR